MSEIQLDLTVDVKSYFPFFEGEGSIIVLIE